MGVHQVMYIIFTLDFFAQPWHVKNHVKSFATKYFHQKPDGNPELLYFHNFKKFTVYNRGKAYSSIFLCQYYTHSTVYRKWKRKDYV